MGILRHFILSIFANAGAVFLASKFVAMVLAEPNHFTVTSNNVHIFFAYCAVGFMLGTMNAIVRPILKIFSLPLVIITMGLFLIVINMGILLAIQYLFNEIVPSLNIYIDIVGGWQTLLVSAFVLSIFNSLTHWLIK